MYQPGIILFFLLEEVDKLFYSLCIHSIKFEHKQDGTLATIWENFENL